MFRNYCLFLILLILFSCKEKTTDFPVIKLQKQITVEDISSGYKPYITKYTGGFKLLFKQTLDKQNAENFLFNIYFDKKIKLKSIIIKNKFQKTLPKFKLYLNEIYTGNYTTGKPVRIYKKVKSLKILFINEKKLIHSWIDDRVINLSKNKNSSPPIQILLNISSEDSIKFHIQRKRLTKLQTEGKKEFIQHYFKNGVLSKSGVYYNKSEKDETKFYLHFSDHNTFSVYELKRKRNDKKVIHEIFFTGYWQYEKISKGIIELKLSGKLHGYFSKEKQKYIKNKFIKIKAKIVNNTLYFNKVFQTLYIDFPENALINLKEFIPAVTVKLAYASKNNFTKTRLYPCNICFIRYKVAKALLEVQEELKPKGMSLIFYDCYRPYHVQKLMFIKFPVKGYVAPPKGGSIHNRGLAVDLSIIDKNGKELDMGTGFDTFSVKAHHSYTGFTDTILNNRLFLKKLMIKHGFSPIRSEWWHYNFQPTHQFPVINDDFLCE
ncbi:MAG: M15 family metallopeptidase [Bacteroidales bacterium]|nr:M15 family metallopeptidase [Bacteroidales bacterium]